MPSFDLLSQSQVLERFDVVAERPGGSKSFVKHVALGRVDGRRVAHDQHVDVVHMGPPLTTEGRVAAHVAGRVPLNSAEIKQIESWIEKIVDEYQHSRAGRSEQYTILPPWDDVCDPHTGVLRYRKYSCAGFVLDAHRQVDVHLLDIEGDSLPEVEVQTLQAAYPNVSPRLLGRFGVNGSGPWRIVLAGYVLHSLSRPSDKIRMGPYQPKSGDENF